MNKTETSAQQKDKTKESGSKPPSPSYALLFGVIAFIVVLSVAGLAYISFCRLKPTDSPPPLQFFIASLLSLLVVLAVIVQVIINWFQWQAMQETLSETRITREIDNAAFIAVTEASLATDGRQHKATLKFRNLGKSPGLNFTIRYQGGFYAERIEDFKAPLDGPMLVYRGFMHPPDSDIMLNIDMGPPSGEHNEVNWYIWGIIEYDDIFGKEHFTGFAYRLRPLGEIIVFEPCPNGNYCDYQQQVEKKRNPN